MTNREVRGGIPVEIRAEADGIKVSGYAAVFNQEADIAGLFREKITPGAFRNAIGRDDVVFLINHDGLPLARTKSGTLTLSEDDHGLRIESTLDPADPDVARIVPKMKRGDLSKMSFAFTALRQSWDDSQDPPLRTIEEVKNLYDVSVVTEPAYEGTDIGLRSLERHREETQKTKNFRAASFRIGRRMNLDLKVRSKAR